MDIVDFIYNLSLNNICVQNSELTFTKFISDKLKNYFLEISEYFDRYFPNDLVLNEELNRLNILIENLVDIVKDYEEGMLFKSRQLFEKIMVEHYVPIILANQINHLNRNTVLYRSRMIETNEIIKKEDMFHLPFHKRRLSGNFRFNLSGYPCLYAAETIYLNWIELNKPPIDKFVSSKLEFIEESKFSIIDFDLNNFSPEILKSKLLNNTGTNTYNIIVYINLIVLYLLLFTRTKDSGSSFTPEYIFSQYFTDFFKNYNDTNIIISGFRYPCTKLSSQNISKYNYIFFTQPNSLSTSKYCEHLSKNFRISDGLPISYCSIINTDIVNNTIKSLSYDINPSTKSQQIEIGKYKLDYPKTIFYKMEYLLNEFDSCNIDKK